MVFFIFRTSKQCLVSLHCNLIRQEIPHRRTDEVSLNNITGLVVAVFNNLSVVGSETHYDLVKMEKMLECFVHLLTRKQWSLNIENGKNFCISIFHWLTQVMA